MSTSKKASLNPLSLLRDAVTIWNLRFWRVALLTAIIAIPGSILRIIQLDSTTDASIISSLAGMFMTVALTWAFLYEKDLMKLRFTQLYVKSSSRILPFIATSVLFAVTALPALMGIFIIVLSAAEQIPLGFLFFGLAVVLLSVFFVIRLSLATVLVVQNEISALNSLRLSWQVTKGYFMKLTFAWVAIIIAIIVVSGALLTLIGLIKFMRENDYALALSSGVLLTFLLPLFIGYSVQIVKRLEK